MAATNIPYSPNGIFCTINGFVLSNLGEDTFIELSGMEPTASIAYGADGGSGVSFSSIAGAKMVATVFDNSPTAAFLSALQQTQVALALAGVQPPAVVVTVFDNFSRTSFNGIGVFTDRPTKTYGKALGTLAFTIEIPQGWRTYIQGASVLLA